MNKTYWKSQSFRTLTHWQNNKKTGISYTSLNVRINAQGLKYGTGTDLHRYSFPYGFGFGDGTPEHITGNWYIQHDTIDTSTLEQVKVITSSKGYSRGIFKIPGDTPNIYRVSMPSHDYSVAAYGSSVPGSGLYYRPYTYPEPLEADIAFPHIQRYLLVFFKGALPVWAHTDETDDFDLTNADTAYSVGGGDITDIPIAILSACGDIAISELSQKIRVPSYSSDGKKYLETYSEPNWLSTFPAYMYGMDGFPTYASSGLTSPVEYLGGGFLPKGYQVRSAHIRTQSPKANLTGSQAVSDVSLPDTIGMNAISGYDVSYQTELKKEYITVYTYKLNTRYYTDDNYIMMIINRFTYFDLLDNSTWGVW